MSGQSDIAAAAIAERVLCAKMGRPPLGFDHRGHSGEGRVCNCACGRKVCGWPQMSSRLKLKKKEPARPKRKNTLFARFTRANLASETEERNTKRTVKRRRHSGSDGRGGAFFEHDELSVKRATSKKREGDRGPNWKVA